MFLPSRLEIDSPNLCRFGVNLLPFPISRESRKIANQIFYEYFRCAIMKCQLSVTYLIERLLCAAMPQSVCSFVVTFFRLSYLNVIFRKCELSRI